MTDKNLDWKADETLPTGKGATKQRFAANGGKEELVIETAPWGEGDLIADGAEIAHVEGDMDGPDAFRELERVAKEYEDALDAFDQADGKVCEPAGAKRK